MTERKGTEEKGTAYGMNLIMKTLKAVGVEKWEDLKGQYVRVYSGGPGSHIYKFGNIMEDDWLDFSTYKEGLPNA